MDIETRLESRENFYDCGDYFNHDKTLIPILQILMKDYQEYKELTKNNSSANDWELHNMWLFAIFANELDPARLEKWVSLPLDFRVKVSETVFNQKDRPSLPILNDSLNEILELRDSKILPEHCASLVTFMDVKEENSQGIILLGEIIISIFVSHIEFMDDEEASYIKDEIVQAMRQVEDPYNSWNFWNIVNGVTDESASNSEKLGLIFNACPEFFELKGE